METGLQLVGAAITVLGALCFGDLVRRVHRATTVRQLTRALDGLQGLGTVLLVLAFVFSRDALFSPSFATIGFVLGAASFLYRYGELRVRRPAPRLGVIAPRALAHR